MNPKHIFVIILTWMLSFPLIAKRSNSPADWQDHPFAATLSLGYTDYQYMMQRDGQTPIFRFAISRDVFSWWKNIFGLELGLQNGNTMRLKLSDADLGILGGLPVQTVMKPLLDVLATLSIPLSQTRPWFLLIKGGGAYRAWQMDREVINSQSLFEGELQAGIEYAVKDWARLNLLYQGVYGGNPNFTVDAATLISAVYHIPTQQSVLFGFSLRF